MTKLYAYVDETGDLGDIHKSPKSSPMFGMAAILCDEAGAVGARQLIRNLKTEFAVPKHKNLSWKEHVRKHEKRKYISQRLSELENIQVIFVYTDKKKVNGTYTQDRGHLYNYVAGKMFRNIMRAAEYWDSSAKDLTIRYSHVLNFDHKNLSYPYLTGIVGPSASLPMDQLSDLQWVDARQYRESDVADLFAGCLNAAITPDQYSNVEGSYLTNIWSLIRHSESCPTSGRYCAIPLGFMPMPTYEQIAEFDWFTCENCYQAGTKVQRRGTPQSRST